MATLKSKSKEGLIRNSIIAGIISSVIFTFLLQPFAVSIWNLLKNNGFQIYTGFNNRIYAAAALGYRYDVERIIYVFISVLFFGMTFSFIIFLIINSKGLDSLQESAEKYKLTRFAKSKAVFWVGRIINICIIIVFLAFSVRQLLSTILVYASTELNASFQQRYNAIRPYLSESEEEALISSWALMKNESDYILINEKLELIAEENGITLPRTLWPDVLNNDYAWP